jgi:hypothetical protein
MLPVVLLAASLAGCATFHPLDRPQSAVVHHHHKAPEPAPVIVLAPPVVEAPPAPEPKPATFAERFRETFGKIRWVH